MKKTKVIISIILCAVIFLCAGCSNSNKLDENGNFIVKADEAEIASLEMKLLSEETIKLEQYKGKKVLLNFWATWCEPCKTEMPALEKLTKDYPDDVIVIAVNCGESKNTIEHYIEHNPYTYPIVLDPTNSVKEKFGGIDSLPTTIIIDENGKIISTNTGASSQNDMYETYKTKLGLK